MPSRSFLVIGDGPQFSELLDYAARHQVANIRFAGALQNEQVASVMRRARLLLHTSRSEGTPTVFLEALASGLPIVCTPSNDYRDLIRQGQEGYVVPNFDVRAFVDCISLLLVDESKRSQMRESCLKQAENYRWRHVAAQVSAWMQGDT
jgi:phosphatidylinositol alpha 1,6-mannosyltransferase